MITYDDGTRLQYTDTDGVEQDVARMADMPANSYALFGMVADPVTYLTDTPAVMPLSLVRVSSDVTFDSASNTITLPAGVWNVWGRVAAGALEASVRGILHTRLEGLGSDGPDGVYLTRGLLRYQSTTYAPVRIADSASFTLTSWIDALSGTSTIQAFTGNIIALKVAEA